MRTFTHILLLLLCCVFDICCFQLLGNFLINSTFCYTLLQFLPSRNTVFFAAGFLLLGTQSFLMYDIFALNFIYLAPLFFLVNTLCYYLASPALICLIALSLGLAGQLSFLYFFKLKPVLVDAYTLVQIGVTLLLLIVSLKWFSTVEQGNRFERKA